MHKASSDLLSSLYAQCNGRRGDVANLAIARTPNTFVVDAGRDCITLCAGPSLLMIFIRSAQWTTVRIWQTLSCCGAVLGLSRISMKAASRRSKEHQVASLALHKNIVACALGIRVALTCTSTPPERFGESQEKPCF